MSTAFLFPVLALVVTVSALQASQLRVQARKLLLQEL